ncbi:unnamed protein product [Polarella glacialis]|uniref:Uncharacterized protein n=1 Tax=Polarella glacialis TaxID=89957 RepID=A0A813GJL2_POLGL|nr:unnamed protein product [Polarella glacialis]
MNKQVGSSNGLVVLLPAAGAEWAYLTLATLGICTFFFFCGYSVGDVNLHGPFVHWLMEDLVRFGKVSMGLPGLAGLTLALSPLLETIPRILREKNNSSNNNNSYNNNSINNSINNNINNNNNNSEGCGQAPSGAFFNNSNNNKSVLQNNHSNNNSSNNNKSWRSVAFFGPPMVFWPRFRPFGAQMLVLSSAGVSTLLQLLASSMNKTTTATTTNTTYVSYSPAGAN